MDELLETHKLKDGRVVQYFYDTESLTASANLTTFVMAGGFQERVSLENILPEDITLFARLNEKLGLYK